ncbi:hypothetical protein BCR44DRAFT_38971 [Catenaria anguillulae PL171]|uniref:Uncharacterized protein n=1 Tax=Catenaria anguillulae PL171 TaxID=765915 RepID=A0A1Y2HCC5_9FUNG|nr:hypothetical protein BCR44DRAFT_38971 [Catenaria anguillulae PL171]
MSSASPIVPATDPLKTYTRLIALGGNIEQPSALTPILGTSLSTRLVHCRKLITRLTLEARTDPQSIPNIAYGLAAHCSDSDEPQGINASSNGALILPWRETTSMNREVAGPDAMDGIRDLTVGMGTVVNSTATGADKERFAIVSLGYAGKELKLDGLAAGNSTASRANATAVSVKSNGVWKQSESSAAGCALTGIEAVYPSFISGGMMLRQHTGSMLQRTVSHSTTVVSHSSPLLFLPCFNSTRFGRPASILHCCLDRSK